MSSSVWEEIENWGKTLKSWQRYALRCAVRHTTLADDDIEKAYQQFLFDTKLSANDPKISDYSITSDLSAEPVLTGSSLVSLKNLRGVNAIPESSSLGFGQNLTVIFGNNGSGKSGFTRFIATACFSRNTPRILPNIFSSDTDQPTATEGTITFRDGSGTVKEIMVAAGSKPQELSSISVFDSEVANLHISKQNPLNFQPAGLDVFPEMIRVSNAIQGKLNSEITERRIAKDFASAYSAPETDVSLAIINISAASNLDQLRLMATFGEDEAARLAELNQRSAELTAGSTAQTLARIKSSKSQLKTLQDSLFLEVEALESEMKAAKAILSEAETITALALGSAATAFATAKSEKMDIEAWDGFVTSAVKYAEVSHEEYPTPDDVCILCNRVFDSPSHEFVQRIWSYTSSPEKEKLTLLNTKINKEIQKLSKKKTEVFTKDSAVRESVIALEPSLESNIDTAVSQISSAYENIINSLRQRKQMPLVTLDRKVIERVSTLRERIEKEQQDIESGEHSKTVELVEIEKLRLQHKSVLAGQIADIEVHINALKWIRRAELASTGQLATRPITIKEKEIFSKIIAQPYRKRFSEECRALQCAVPLSLQAKGVKGQTQRSLKIEGGHSPIDILSEGEQRAVALADFLTEVSLNPASGAIVLDDPVTSQDHIRKRRIAERLVKEAKSRQVIVFTHDIVFLNNIFEISKIFVIQTDFHWIQIDGISGGPGIVFSNAAPVMKSKKPETSEAKACLAAAKAASGQDQISKVRQGAGVLRTTIEDVIIVYLLKEVVTRWSERVMVGNLKKVFWINEQIQLIDYVYGRCSALFDGHSHSLEMQELPPSCDALDDLIHRVDEIIAVCKSDKPN